MYTHDNEGAVSFIHTVHLSHGNLVNSLVSQTVCVLQVLKPSTLSWKS